MGISLETIIGLVLVTGALIVLWYIYLGVANVFAGSQDKAVATRNNFMELHTQLQEMPDSSTKEMPVFINEGWFVVAFQKDTASYTTQLTETCGLGTAVNQIQRPEICSGACICLCKVETKGCEKNANCRSFDKDYYLRGTGTCSVALVSGSKSPQIITLRKFSDSQGPYLSFGPKQQTINTP